jgi:predicted metalloprotease with PDZ domain
LTILCWLPARAATDYAIDLADAKRGRLLVHGEAYCERAPCTFLMPAWSATYQIREFAKYVEGLEAETQAGQPLRVRKVTPSRWEVDNTGPETVRFRYSVLADRPGPFGASAGADHVCLNLAQVLIFPVASRAEPFSLRFSRVPKRWKTAIALDERGGAYHAPSYDRLIDTPVHLSDSEERSFVHHGRTIRMVFHGPRGYYNPDLVEHATRKIVAAASELMGGLPLDGYLFVYHFSNEDGGGMEFRNGTSIYGPEDCSRCELSSLSAHEFFHLWNVKRIRPRSLEPIDFEHGNVTPSLWFAEGVTSTYSQYIRLRAGLLSEAEFISYLGRLADSYERRPASRTQSAEESSIEAWLERYPGYGRPERSVSYYLKGELVGHLLDLAIRHYSENQRSLDDVMRRMNVEYSLAGRYYEDTAAIERIASDAAGRDMVGVFDALVRTPSPIDWDTYLGWAGYRLASSRQTRRRIGIHASSAPGEGVRVASVDEASPAESAGLKRGDRIVALNGSRITGGSNSIAELIERADTGKVSLDFERGGSAMTIEVIPRESSVKSYRIEEVEKPTPEQLALRRGWLTRQTVAPQAVSQ